MTSLRNESAGIDITAEETEAVLRRSEDQHSAELEQILRPMQPQNPYGVGCQIGETFLAEQGMESIGRRRGFLYLSVLLKAIAPNG